MIKTTYKYTQDNESCLKPVYSIWFVTLKSIRLRIFNCKYLLQQANIIGRKIVVHMGLEPATFGFQA